MAQAEKVETKMETTLEKLSDFTLHLADSALILGQRNAEWSGHGPILEEDLAMANNSLDLIGQARLLYQQVAEIRGNNCSEDQLAYFRDESAFKNFTLLELPHSTALAPSAKGQRDYAVTVARNFLYSAYMMGIWSTLASTPSLAAFAGANHEVQVQNEKALKLANLSTNLKAVASKSYKETEYHLRHASDWVIRMGDGTTESHQRIQQAFHHLMPYTQEFWTQQSPAALQLDLASIKAKWDATVSDVLSEATLVVPSAQGFLPTGTQGVHSEHMGFLLSEMQGLARAHPGAVW
jgi:ring-1,2-phenylacetyl-CoA epoxidase subunit PaaC